MATKKSVVVPKRTVKWAEHCTDVEFEDWETLSPEELRVILSILGIGIHSTAHIKKKDALVDRMLVQMALDTVLGQYAYELVVLHKASVGHTPTLNAFNDLRFKEDVKQLLHTLREGAVAEAVRLAHEQAKLQSEQVVKDWLDERVAQYREVVVRSVAGTAKVTGKTHKAFSKVLQLAGARKNICLVGPAGCGKTHMAAQVAEGLKLPFAAQSMSAGVSESAFVGTLLPTGKGGEYVHLPTPFLDMYENGGVFLWDEMDNADANLLVFLNMALGNKSFFLPIRKGAVEVKKHKDFVAIAAMNTFGHGGDMKYVGRSQLDAATLDRFRIGMVMMDYDDELEESLVKPSVLSWGREVRRALVSSGIERIMSTRALLDASDMLSVGWDLQQVKEAYFTDWTRDERSLVRS